LLEETATTTRQRATKHSISRLFLMLLTLFLMLIGINVLYTWAANWQGILRGDPGELLYAAGFDAFSEEWQQYSGREAAQIQEGALRIRMESTLGTVFSAAQPHFADFDVAVTTRAVEGDIDNAYGIAFRLQQPQSDCDMSLIILCDLSRIDLFGVPLRLLFRPQDEPIGFYLFLISSDGFYSVWRGADGETRKLSTWIASDAIRQGLDVENRIRVIGRADAYQFFINDTQVELCIPDDPAGISTFASEQCFEGSMQPTLQDDTFQQGQIGLVLDTTQTGNTGIMVEFDDVVVFSPVDEFNELEGGSQT